MTQNLSATTDNLQPWIILVDEQPCLWRLQTGKLAVAMFSSSDKASAYAKQQSAEASDVFQPTAMQLVQILIACFEADVPHAVLDPDGGTAKRIFDLPEILKKVRDDLRAGKPLAL